MPDDRPIINPMRFTFIVQAGAEAKASTATIWAEIRGYVEEQGGRLDRQAWETVNRLRSVYAQQRITTERFLKAPPETPFDTRFAAPEVNMRPIEVRDILPEYLARFNLNYIDRNGDRQTRKVTYRGVWEHGLSVGDVAEKVARAAEGFALDYGISYESHSIINLVMV